jgi:phenylalanyl-tRNA synthetase alpha chain
LKDLDKDERRIAGKEINDLKGWAENRLDELKAYFEDEEKRKRNLASRIDITMPGKIPVIGKKHPISQTLEEIIKIFSSLGFSVAEGPDIEPDYYNFEALNIPKDHPARDMQDTFYVDQGIVLRTHTSPVQIRTMESQLPPVKIIAPGAVYRCDSDVSHTPMFHQVEGLMVDKHIRFSDLKGTLSIFIQEMFGSNTSLRFRPSYFPFTEPSAEVDIGCVICEGSGCRVCKNTGWLEILGSGMVHPQVFRIVGYDPEEVTGFAFGMGVERIAMLKFGIDDIRQFYYNDLRFLSQF